MAQRVLDKEGQIVSKARVSNFGEVLTGEREVKAMLDLVKQETERIESRFLEPACGNGNFLIEILRRKLDVVDDRYKQSQLEWERNAILALTSIYGIEIQPDNTEVCRKRLFDHFNERYSALFKAKSRQKCRESARLVLSLNIVCGDALSLKTTGDNPSPIVFSEWSPVNGSLFKRRDYEFHELSPGEPAKRATLFGQEQQLLLSDDGAQAFIPTPVREFPLTHFLELKSAKSG